MRRIIQEVEAEGMSLALMVCDNPKRCFWRCTPGSTGYYSCDSCEDRGIPFKYGKLNKRSKVTWPYQTSGKLRTHERILAQGRAGNGAAGVSGVSVLAEHVGFDLANQIPLDSMHHLFLGCARRLLKFCTGDIGKGNSGSGKKLAKFNMKHLDEMLTKSKLPTECSRKTRPMDMGSWKASDWRNMTIFFFTHVSESFEIGRKDERELWANFAFICRACNLTNIEFQDLNRREAYLTSCATKIIRLVKKLYGGYNQNYSFHQLLHLDKARQHGPLCQFSAFGTEGLFAKVKPNVFKQIMNKF